MAKQRIVALKELRQNMEYYANEVKKGKSFLVLKRSKPFFSIVPPEIEAIDPDNERFDRLIAEISALVREKFSGVELPSMKEQLRKLDV
jgi:antitoxin (DNA-binding transcriptional repressor) of toxin-antitoxin stability system